MQNIHTLKIIRTIVDAQIADFDEPALAGSNPKENKRTAKLLSKIQSILIKNNINQN